MTEVMDAASLQCELATKFDIVCFYDLADAMVSHGAIFKIFKLHFQNEFRHNQRLIFYSQFEPSQLVLDHLQRAAASINISNFFIIICGPHNIQSQLTSANQKYGSDSDSITWYQCALLGTQPINSDCIYSFETFCAVPFGVLTTNSTSSILPCCKYTEVIGSVENTTLANAFSSKQMNQLRDDIRHGRRHQACKSCWDVEDSGNVSMRKHFINKYGNQCDQEWVDQPRVRDLTISPSSLCNFKCRICGPWASSKIAAEELTFTTDPEKQLHLKTIIKDSTRQNAPILDQIYEIAADLRSLHIMGGEPFLWPDLDTLLDRLLAADLAKDIQIEFNTNGSVFSKHTIDRLLQFKSVEILLSIDDVGDRFELQRGGSWAQVLQNILSFKQLKSSTFAVKIINTVNIQNLLYLDQFVDFCDSNDLEIVWWFLENPSCLSIDFVTAATKDAVYKKYINHTNSELQAIAKRIVTNAAVNGDTFLNYMHMLDQRRGQNSSTVLKEIFDTMSA